MYDTTKMFHEAGSFVEFTRSRAEAIEAAKVALKPIGESDRQDIEDSVHLGYNQAGWDMGSPRRTTAEIYERLKAIGRETGPSTTAARQKKRQGRLDEMARQLGYDSWRRLETAALNGQRIEIN